MKKAGPGQIAFHAFKTFFAKPVTTSYAGKGSPVVESRYRGLLKFKASDCINCHLCMRDCPTGAITIINEGTKEEKKMKALLNTGRCVFCGQCVETCPKTCLSLTEKVDLASLNKDDLTVEI